MKKILLVISALSILVACSQAEQKPVAGHVVLIGSDGFSSAVVRANPGAFPNIEKLMAEGSHTLARRSVLPSSSAVNWASMFMGAGPELHGYTEWGSKTPELPSRVTTEGGLFPGIQRLIRDTYPEATTGCAFHWPTIGCLYEQDAVSWNYNAPNDTLVVDSICVFIEREKPLFAMAVFDEPDVIGHSIGWESPEYVEVCKMIDDFVGRIVTSIENAGMKDNTVIIFTSDHGGTGTGHGGKTMAEMESPFVICGKGIKKGHAIDESMMVFDTAPTIAHILNVKQPQVWIGRPVESVFEE